MNRFNLGSSEENKLERRKTGGRETIKEGCGINNDG
jgi:hypothetical protein